MLNAIYTENTRRSQNVPGQRVIDNFLNSKRARGDHLDRASFLCREYRASVYQAR
jgi:hypothetical protein